MFSFLLCRILYYLQAKLLNLFLRLHPFDICAQLLQLAGIRDDLLRRGELYAKQIAQLMMVRLDQEWVELQHLHHQTAGCIYDHTCALALHALHDALIHIVWQRSGDAAGNHEHVLIADSVDLSKQRFQLSFIDSLP